MQCVRIHACLLKHPFQIVVGTSDHFEPRCFPNVIVGYAFGSVVQASKSFSECSVRSLCSKKVVTYASGSARWARDASSRSKLSYLSNPWW